MSLPIKSAMVVVLCLGLGSALAAPTHIDADAASEGIAPDRSDAAPIRQRGGHPRLGPADVQSASWGVKDDGAVAAGGAAGAAPGPMGDQPAVVDAEAGNPSD